MDRNYLYLSFTEFVYVRLKGIIWAYNGSSKPNNLDKNAGDALTEIYEKIEVNKTMLVDCKGVTSLTDHSWDSLFQIVNSSGREIIFLNHHSLEEKLTWAKKEFCNKMNTNDDGGECMTIYKTKIKLK